jgi:hypothetical protein
MTETAEKLMEERQKKLMEIQTALMAAKQKASGSK